MKISSRDLNFDFNLLSLKNTVMDNLSKSGFHSFSTKRCLKVNPFTWLYLQSNLVCNSKL
ncbi:hypothetical protein BpHYR1_004908 [Brachionus plicatilis]|uniref:Uncharacterized protein n=1 Tax=Brachionus plicatilis TaxID=10195 RepID=A0A3M7RR67_BRAPC|nr:hypothetical protein BpHYR1_004908 [Brachionus plicatilis]